MVNTSRKGVKKVVLVQPNTKWIDWNWKTSWDLHPMSLCLLGAVIRDEYDVTVVDAYVDNQTPEEFQRIIAGLKPDIVGLTMMTNEYLGAVHQGAALVKEVDPEIITVIGGVYATVSYKAIHEDANFDYICIGEGEHVFPELLAYLNGDASFPSLGFLGHKEGEQRDPNTVVRAPLIQDLDALPYPAWDLVDYGRYISNPGKITVDQSLTFPFTRLMTSRGCPIGCTFCEVATISGGPFRYRSVDNIMAELTWLIRDYGIRSFMLDDDNFFINRKRVIEFCQALIDLDLQLEWKATAVAVFHMTDHVIEIMAKSGCNSINLAIESGNERVLQKIIHKPVKLDRAAQVCHKIKEAGMDLLGNFIVGFPTETWEEVRNTFKFAEGLPTDYCKFFIATPLEGTILYDMVMENNLMAINADTSGQMKDLDWQTGKILSDEWTIEDLTILRAYEWDRINFATPKKREKVASMMNISLEELGKLRQDTLKSATASILKMHEQQLQSGPISTDHHGDHRSPQAQSYPSVRLAGQGTPDEPVSSSS